VVSLYAGHSVILWMILLEPQRPSYSGGAQVSFQAALHTWMALCVGIQCGYERDSQSDDLCLIYVIIGALITCFLMIYAQERRMVVQIKYPIASYDTEYKFTCFIYSAIINIEKSSERKSKAWLQIIIKNYYDYLCSINDTAENIESAKEILVVTSKNSFETKDSVSLKLVAYQILVDLIERNKLKYPKNSYLSLLYAYIKRYKLDSIWVALAEAQQIYAESSDIRLCYGADLFIREIEHSMAEYEIRRKETAQVDVVALIDFQKKSADFNELLVVAYELNYSFWTHLSKEKLNVNIIKTLGSKLIHTNKQLKNTYDAMTEQTGNQNKATIIYGQYLHLVANETEESEKLLSKAKIQNMGSTTGIVRVEDKKLRNTDASNLSIVIASGEGNRMGEIISVNSETLRLFEFSSEEILGSNVEMLMPRIYAERHQHWMANYFNYNEGAVMGVERRVFARNKNGFIIACQLYIKILPDIRNQLSVVGLLSPDNNSLQLAILIDKTTGALIGSTQKCFRKFGLTGSNSYGGHPNSAYQLNFNQIFPNAPNVTTLLSKKELSSKVILDTTILQTLSPLSNPELYLHTKPGEVFAKHEVKIIDHYINSYDKGSLQLVEIYLRELKPNNEVDEAGNSIIKFHQNGRPSLFS